MSETPAIAVVGHICLDIIPKMRTNTSIEPGRLIDVGAATIATGGAVANVGLALRRLGCATRLVADVGNDPFGREVRELLRHDDPRTIEQIHEQPGVATSYSIVISPDGGDRTFLHCAGANDEFRENGVDFNLLAGCRILHFGYPANMKRIREDGGEALAQLFAEARHRGMITSLDTTLPDPGSVAGRADWPAFLERVLPQTDLFCPSVEELMYMVDRSGWQAVRESLDGDISEQIEPQTVRRLAEQVLRLGARGALVKQGASGIYLRTAPGADRVFGPGWAECEIAQPAFAVDVTGTTGAGDCTIAGLLCEILHGSPPAPASQFAAACGACSCEARDATSGVQPRDQILNRISHAWPQKKRPQKKTQTSARGSG